jgi:acyl dehydratase
MTDWSRQRLWSDVSEGDDLPSIAFPLSVYRLVVAAAGTLDFNAIHHNSEYARTTGAPEMYANTMLLQGMWERCVREFIGLDGVIHRIAGFRMRSFSLVGETVVVHARVERKWLEDGSGFVEIAIRSETDRGVTVGPGMVTVSLPVAV